MAKGTTKKALVLSVLAMLLCCAMLVGTTFAWFTDTATSGDNKIVAGNLDVELLDENDDPLTDSIFDDSFLWEPGAMQISDSFKVANVGNLALWYDLSLAVVEETLVNGHSLTEVIAMKVVKAADVKKTIEDTQAARAELWDDLADKDLMTQDTLAAGAKSEELAVVLYWAPTDHDNDYNMNNDNQGKELSITFGLNVYATQAPVEPDHFGPNYDENAKATRVLHNTVVAGVDKVNALMDYAVLSALEGSDNVYTSIVTVTNGTKTVAQVYLDISDTLFTEVESQADYIQSITIDTYAGDDHIGNAVVTTITAEELGAAIYKASGEEITSRTTIGELAAWNASITVTIEDVNGVELSYTLKFVQVAANEIHDTVVAGVDKLNNLMDYAELSALREEDGKYVSDVKVSNDSTTVAQVYLDIGETLFAEVESQKANIASITISALNCDSKTTTDITVDGLTAAAYECVTSGNINGRTTLAELVAVNAYIEVTIVDVNNVSLTYMLNFVAA